MREQEIKLELNKKQKQIEELYTLIDTLQVNLRTAVNQLNKEDKESLINTPSYKWCSSWKIGDEINE